MIGLRLERDLTETETARERQELAEFGRPVELSFRLPGGQDCTKQFRTGHQIQYVKAVLHQDCDLPMNMVLVCKGRKLIDPLSIADCPTITESGLNLVDVQVQ